MSVELRKSDEDRVLDETFKSGSAEKTPPRPVGIKPLLKEIEPWVLVATLIVYFGRVLFLSETLFFRDIHLHYLPKLQYLGDLLRAGQPPFWNWLLHGGQPFFARPMNQALYPPHLLTVIFDPVSTFNIEILFHIALGIGGTYLLIRRLGWGRESAFLGAAVFGCSGYLLSSTSNIFTLFSLSLMPVSVLAWHEFWSGGRRLWVIVAVMATTLQWLSGGAEVLVLTTVFLMIWSATFPYSRAVVPRMIGFAAVQVLVLGLVAIQVIPMLHVIAESARAEGLSFETWSSWSVHPKRLPELLISGFMGRTDTLVEADYWGGRLVSEGFPYILSFYLGILPISLALVGVSNRSNSLVSRKFRAALILLVVVFVILAFGRFLPGMRTLFELVPAAGLLRHPVKFMAITLLPLALLAAAGLHGIPNGAKEARRAGAVVAVLVGSIGAGWIWSAIDPARFASAVAGYFGAGSAGAAVGVGAALGRSAIVGLAGLGLIALAIRYRRRWPVYALGFLVVADLLSVARMVNPSTSASLVLDPPPVASFLLESGKEGRLFRDPMPKDRVIKAPNREISHLARFSREVLDAYVCWAYGIPTIFHDDYDSLASREVRRLYARMQAAPWADRLPVLSASSVRWIITHRDLDLPGLTLVGSIPNRSTLELRLYENTKARPFAYLVQRAIVVETSDEAYERVVSQNFDPSRDVVLEGVLEDPVQELVEGDTGTILRAQMTPNRWHVEVKTASRVYLVFGEIFDPGWRVWIDGHEAEVLRANAAFSAVALSPGKHVVERRYRPPGLMAGALVSIASLLILVFWMARLRDTPAHL